MTPRRPVLAVAPATAHAARPRLMAALAAALDVDLVPLASGAPADAVLAIGDDTTPPPPDALTRLADGAPVLGVAGVSAPAHAVTLLAADGVDRRLHGVVVDGAATGVLTPEPGATPLATTAAGVAWTAGATERVAGPLPELAPTQTLRDALHGDATLALVALVQLARRLTGETPGPTRASIIFDDPNLRRPRYGHLRYAELLAHADAHDYHASMAMIPLDARRGQPHPRAAALFRTRPDRLSLSIHGNDHEGPELLRTTAFDPALSLCAQALGRVERFERLTGIAVDRVMVPPHGMCSSASARALGALPFAALCAIHPQPWTETPDADRPLAGWEPATFVEGCPVIPRAPFDWRPTEIALRAFLGHPIVLYGHHGDVADGLDPLAAAAAAVNRLGDVRWCSLAGVAHANHRLAVDGTLATVRPFARELAIDLPDGVQELAIAAPSEGADGLDGWRLDDGPAAPLGTAVPVPGDGPRTVRVALRSRWETSPATVTLPSPRLRPVLRRAGTELRDRLAPLRA